MPLVLEAAVWGTLLGDPPFDAVDVGAVDGECGYARVPMSDPGSDTERPRLSIIVADHRHDPPS